MYFIAWICLCFFTLCDDNERSPYMFEEREEIKSTQQLKQLGVMEVIESNVMDD